MASGYGLLAVHAHPDDETIATGGVLAKAVSEGRPTMVVTCTDGRRGEVVGAGMDPAEVKPRLVEVRRAELAAALAELGVPHHEFLGYHDSGMMGTEGNEDPESFWQADVDQAVGRLVRIIREFKPAVLVTYDAFGGYGHPDHIQTHRVGLLAAEASGMAALYPEAGPAWHVPKVYFSTIPKSVIGAINQYFKSAGIPSPFGEVDDVEQIPMGTPDDMVTTIVDVRAQIDSKRRAIDAHASQIAPDSFFLNFPDEMVEAFYGQEWFIRHRTAVPVQGPEDNLFTGLDY